ncbi:NAD(P)/FAD-dependent oxidoreductase, partial [uncultured Holdemanella sp.]|uniref:NAD(P)/FAD-dependent oxidoreductase n=1 Tax=uncultured Holdemanella sp. TaxID=1763549 RepID=UPI0026012255
MERQYDLVIIGAGPAGLSAALYGSRAGLKTLILENGAPGGKLIKTNKISNYPGVKEIEGTQLAMDMFEQATSFQAEYAYGEVNKIDENKNVYLSDGNIVCGEA